MSEQGPESPMGEQDEIPEPYKTLVNHMSASTYGVLLLYNSLARELIKQGALQKEPLLETLRRFEGDVERLDGHTRAMMTAAILTIDDTDISQPEGTEAAPADPVASLSQGA